jgi:hypothetical protein
MARPTHEQVEQEVAALESLKDKVKPHTAFGDDNQKAVQLQIDVLQASLEGKNPDENYLEEEMGLELGTHAYQSAREAVDWLNGTETEETLSEGWEPITKSHEAAAETPAEAPPAEEPPAPEPTPEPPAPAQG